MTCHVCAKPNCVDDCVGYTPPPSYTNNEPPALNVGSAEYKLQELLKIANELTYGHINHDPYGDHTCKYCVGISSDFNVKTIKHYDTCPILKLEHFKAQL